MKIKSSNFGNLAMRYYPDRTYQMAVRLFRKEIEDTPGLLNALKKVGYTHNQRILTPRQIRVIEARLD